MLGVPSSGGLLYTKNEDYSMTLLTPEKLAASGTEDGTQRAYLQSVRICGQFAEEISLIYHVPNGGYRGDDRSAMIAGAKMKALGAKSGVPDICLPISRLGYGSLFIEFKKPNGKEGIFKDQAEYIKLLTRNGNLVVITHDWAQARDITLAYLNSDEEYIISEMLPSRIPENWAKLGHNTNLIDTFGYLDKYNALPSTKEKVLV